MQWRLPGPIIWAPALIGVPLLPVLAWRPLAFQIFQGLDSCESWMP